jgi:hypothetical protein
VVVVLKNSQGQQVGTATTDANGFYQFTNLPPDVYTLYVPTPASGYVAAYDAVGTVNGSSDGNAFDASTLTGINLTSGNIGIKYDFIERLGS